MTATLTGTDVLSSEGASFANSSAFEPLMPKLVLVRAVPQRELPQWLPYVLRRLNDLALKLDEPDPDDPAIPDPIALERSLAELQRLLADDTPTPSVVPTSEGGVQFVWHKGGWDIEIEVLPSETLAWGRNRSVGARWSGELEDVQAALVDALQQIASPATPDRG